MGGLLQLIRTGVTLMATKKQNAPPTPPTTQPTPTPCEHEWEIMEGSTAGMSDGQATDYMAGIWRNAWCRKCHGLKVVEGDFGDGVYDDEY
jgi:hypothetical protein